MHTMPQRARLQALQADLAERFWRDEPIETLMTSLQGAGVPAYHVSSGVQLVTDPQIVHRQHYADVEHAKQGALKVDTPSFQFDALEPRIKAGPLYAEHTAEVLHDWLALDDDAISELIAGGALVF